MALASAKRVSELHILSIKISLLKRVDLTYISYGPDFVAENQNLLVQDLGFKGIRCYSGL